MNLSFKALGLAGALLLAPVLAPTAQAIPLLQLDVQGGVYDPVTETIVAPGGTFTVYAILTPQKNASAAEIAALLNTTYYLSAAISPQLAPPGANLGSFAIGPAGGTQTTVSATSGMTYGVPPLDLALINSGSLAPHSIYPTYFSEFSFQFSAANKTTAYNTADNPGGPTPDPNGTAYYFAFTGDSTLLSAFALHFDLYGQSVKDCAKNSNSCSNLAFAPFSHDAQVNQVPGPSAALVMFSGLALAVGTLRQRVARK